MKQLPRVLAVALVPSLLLAVAPVPDEAPKEKPASKALVEASAGFNDAEGMNADKKPDSPYPLGAKGKPGGEGEPGWAGPWPAADGVIYQKDVVFEGDGAMFMSGTAGTTRRLKVAHDDVFQVEQHVQVPADGNFTGYIKKSQDVTGPMWKVQEGKFLILDGDEKGDGRWTETGFACIPGRWYRVTLHVDVPKQRWQFSVDGKQFGGGPWRFRHKVEYLIDIHYLCESAAGAYIDALKIGPVADPTK